MLRRLLDLNSRAIRNHLCGYEVDQAALYFVARPILDYVNSHNLYFIF